MPGTLNNSRQVGHFDMSSKFSESDAMSACEQSFHIDSSSINSRTLESNRKMLLMQSPSEAS
jgi:hypothetical protein